MQFDVMNDNKYYDIRKVLIILDGMDDEKHMEQGGKTPRESAFMPTLQQMRREGQITLLNTIPSGNAPATDVALLKILGHNVPENFTGRAWLEALGEGIIIGEKDLCLRCNLIKTENGKIASHAVEDISDTSVVIDALNNNFSNSKYRFYSGKGYRNLLVIKNCDTNIKVSPVHTLIGAETESLLVECDNLEIQHYLNNIIIKAPEVLAKCLHINANGVALWAPGKKPDMYPLIKDGVVIAGVSLVKGIGKWMGMTVINVKGATGGYDTDLVAKMDATAEALRNHHFVLLHIEAPDEASHMRSFQKKKEILEKIDKLVLAPLLKLPYDIDVTVQSDHATSSLTGLHLTNPVEVVKYHIKNCPNSSNG